MQNQRPLSPTSAQGNRIYWGRMETTALGSCKGPEDEIKSPFFTPKKAAQPRLGVCRVPAVFALGCWAGERPGRKQKAGNKRQKWDFTMGTSAQ